VLSSEAVCFVLLHVARATVVPVQADTGPHDIEQGGCYSPKSQKDKDVEAAEPTREKLLTMALSFYDLRHTHIIHEEDPDTKVHS
jgi:hypothetical protein